MGSGNDNEPELNSGSEEKKCSVAKDGEPWCYLFVHRAKVEIVTRMLGRQFPVFIHKSIVYKRENKRVSKDERPTISGLVFVQGCGNDIQSLLSENFFGLYLVKDCCTGCTAVIPDDVMRPFMRLSGISPTRIRFMPHTFDYYSAGNTLVRITSGVLAGLEGYRIRISRDKCFVTSLGGMTVAVGGIHRESFENLDEYVRQRREQLSGRNEAARADFTPLQAEIDAGFFTPQNSLDVMGMSESAASWVGRAKAHASEKDFGKAIEIALFILEETGSRFRSIHNDPRIGGIGDIMQVCRETDGLLLSIANSPDIPGELREMVETGRESLAIRYPFLPIG